MKENSLRARLRLIVAGLFLAVLLAWLIFFLYTARSLAAEAEKNANQTAAQIIDILSEEFLLLDRLSLGLNQSGEVLDFVTERDVVAYHEKAAAVSALLEAAAGRPQLLGSLIVYTDAQTYYRFWGSIGNTAASKIYYTTSALSPPRSFAISLEGMPHIGYVSGIRHGGGQIGAVVMLIEEGRLLHLFNRYCGDGGLQVSLAAEGRLITSTDSELVGLTAEELRHASYSTVSRKVGFTPFEILVSSESGYLLRGGGGFILAALTTGLIFAGLLAVFTRMLNRHFFHPMLDIMNAVELLGTDESAHYLPEYSGESFARLAGTINSMLERLEERNATIYETRFMLQNAEIERQKSVIVSLKKQISTHFTVNVLSGIKLLAEKGEMEKAGEMCDGLSYLLQYANAGDEFINGLEEFFVLQKYVSIMRIRYQNRFAAYFDPDDRLGDISIPRMLIQPLIENGIHHGLQNQSGGLLLVSARMEQSRLTVTVEDNGRGMDAHKLAEVRAEIASAGDLQTITRGLHQIALPNIQRRILSYYGEGSGLSVFSEPGAGTKVVITLSGVSEY